MNCRGSRELLDNLLELLQGLIGVITGEQGPESHSECDSRAQKQTASPKNLVPHAADPASTLLATTCLAVHEQERRAASECCLFLAGATLLYGVAPHMLRARSHQHVPTRTVVLPGPDGTRAGIGVHQSVAF